MRSAEDEAKDAKKATEAEKGEKAKKSAAVEGKKVETKAPKKEHTAALPDDVVTQIAQAKYEAQEDKLRDVARHSMALIRDFQKLDEQDCIRKIADIQRSLVKYEMQYIRAWEIEEHRRSRELVDLEAMRARFRKDAETEERQLEGQRKVLQKGLIKRKRYEGYEELATAVNSKRPQHDSKAEIERVTADLSQMRAHGERFGRLAEFRDEYLGRKKQQVSTKRAQESVPENFYNLVADRMADALKNQAYHSRPLSQASRRFTELTRRGAVFPVEELVEAFDASISRESIRNIVSEMFSTCHAEALVMGNETAQDALDLVKKLETSLGLKCALKELPRFEEAQLPAGRTLWMLDSTDKERILV
ncbi:unnamed protein product [Symbiodinium sp. KB8]|nr:unnamed protein product [Symbiodinium sp. KB8]